jgi:serine/threonine protein kinase
MSAQPLRRAVGDLIGVELTVLGIVDERGREPVYIVWHHRAWCPMACKLYRSGRKAEAEAKVMSALSHPNIVRLLGVGKPPHVLMEFLEGPTLRQLLKSRPNRRLGISDSLRLAIHLCAALVHMHERGFLHLDIKPANVIVARSGRPALFDFGTARPHDQWDGGHLAGTDPYMAPEQCRREPVTPATDVFGLGVTLFEMLTGELPFPRASRRNPFPQTADSPVPVRNHRSDVAASLDALVLRCLAPNPADRPSSPAELALLLHPFIRSGPPMWPTGFYPQTTPVPAGCASRPPRPGSRRHDETKLRRPVDPRGMGQTPPRP